MPPAHRRHAAELLQHLTSYPSPSYTGFITDENECSMNTYTVILVVGPWKKHRIDMEAMDW